MDCHVESDIERYSSESDRPILKWLYENRRAMSSIYCWGNVSTFLYAYVMRKAKCTSVRVYSPTSLGVALYRYFNGLPCDPCLHVPRKPHIVDADKLVEVWASFFYINKGGVLRDITITMSEPVPESTGDLDQDFRNKEQVWNKLHDMVYKQKDGYYQKFLKGELE